MLWNVSRLSFARGRRRWLRRHPASQQPRFRLCRFAIPALRKPLQNRLLASLRRCNGFIGLG